MFECSIFIENENQMIFDYLQQNLREKTKGIDCVISCFEQDMFQVVQLQCREDSKHLLIGAIKNVISQCGVLHFKKQYIARKLSGICYQDKKQLAFQKALSYFDDDTDLESIFDKIEVSPHIFLNSYFEFLLKNQKLKWDRVCELANEHPIAVLNETSFIGLLEFLVDNTPCLTKIVKLTPQESGLKIVYENHEQEISSEDLLEKMIELSPKQIIFDGTLEDFLFCSKYTYFIFEKKVTFHALPQPIFSNIKVLN